MYISQAEENKNRVIASIISAIILALLLLFLILYRLITPNPPFPIVAGGGGGIENCCGVPATINDMLLQSHEGLLRLFPVWPENQDAKFENLRAYGAFLVSSAKRDGKVEYVKIFSEKGRKCILHNPWPGKSVQIVREKGLKEKVNGSRIIIKTEKEELLTLTETESK